MQRLAAALAAVVLALLAAPALAGKFPAPQVELADGAVLVGQFQGFSHVADGGRNALFGLASTQQRWGVLKLNETGFDLLTEPFASTVTISAIAYDADTETYYIGGSFSQVNGAQFGNIAGIRNNRLFPLDQGLNGAVASIAVKDGIVYAGGSFTAAVGRSYTYPSSSRGLQRIARFIDGRWQPMPGLGLNNNVRQVLFNGDKLYAIGDFTQTFDLESASPRVPDQFVSVTYYGITSTGNLTGYGPENLLNNSDLDPAKCWFSRDGVYDSVTIDLGVPTQVTWIRIGNAVAGNRTGYAVSITAPGSLSHWDPAYRVYTTSSSIRLSREPSNPWTDLFILPYGDTLRTLTIEMSGDGRHLGGGICAIEVYRSVPAAYPTYNAQQVSVATQTSDWAKVGSAVDAAGQEYRATIASTSNFPRIALKLDSVETALYNVIVYGNGCSGACVSAATVTVSLGPDTVSYATTFTQSTSYTLYARLPVKANSTIFIRPEGANGDQFFFTRIELQREYSITGLTTSMVEYDLTLETVSAVTPNQPLGSNIVRALRESSDSLILFFGTDLGYGYVARYNLNTNNVTALANGGLSSSVNAAALLPGGGFVIGGSFLQTRDGFVRLNYVAIYKNDRWTALGKGISAAVSTLAVVGDRIYFGGSFTRTFSIGDANSINPPFGTAALNVAVFNLTLNDWVPLVHTGFTSSNFFSDGTNLLAAGHSGNQRFASLFANGVARWSAERARFETLNFGFTREVGTVGGVATPIVRAVASYQGNVYVGGQMSGAGMYDNFLRHVAMYNETSASWQSLGGGVGIAGGSGSPEVRTLAVYRDQLWVGGAFNLVYDDFAIEGKGLVANGLGVWDGNKWVPVAPILRSGTSVAAVNVLYHPDGWDYDIIVAGGVFSFAGEVSCNNVCIWDGSMWSALGLGVSGTVNAIAHAGSVLIVGGSFSYAGGMPVGNIASYDFNTGVWRPMDYLYGTVNSIVVNGGLNSVFVGYAQSYTSSYHNHLAHYDGQYFNLFGYLLSSSTVSSVQLVSASNAPGNDLLPGGTVLHVCGTLNIRGQNGASTCAVFDGLNWFPQSLGVAVSGTPIIRGVLFPQPQYYGLSRAGVIALSVIFGFLGLVLLGLLLFFLVRRCMGASRGSAGATKYSDDAAVAKQVSSGTGAAIALGAVKTSASRPTTVIAASAVPLGEYRATQAFEAQDSGELSLAAGDIVTVLNNENSDWWHGRVGQRSGWFPKSFVEPTQEKMRMSSYDNPNTEA